MDIEANILSFLGGNARNRGHQPTERYASFDYCYNYFRSFREKECVNEIASPHNIQQSCLQLAFYLASWGMLRGSGFLLQKSAKFYEPLIHCIAAGELALWDIDADRYTEENLDRLVCCEQNIMTALKDGGYASPTLVTKIMLGVYGNVPAFDNYLVRGLGIRWNGRKSLRRIAAFYGDHRAAIDHHTIYTLDFATGSFTPRRYPKAKIIDMVGFIEGQR